MCVSHSESLCSLYPLDLLDKKKLGKQLSYPLLRASRQDGSGVCPKTRRLSVRVPKLSFLRDLKKIKITSGLTLVLTLTSNCLWDMPVWSLSQHRPLSPSSDSLLRAPPEFSRLRRGVASCWKQYQNFIETFWFFIKTIRSKDIGLFFEVEPIIIHTYLPN